jgi:hypothetical protein
MIYIAGQITGLPIEVAEKKFEKAEQDLRRLDLKVINPLKLGIPYSWSWHDQLAECKRVITKEATAIYLLRGWQNSKGAREERDHVDQLNKLPTRRILIFEEDDYGMSAIKLAIRNKELTCLTIED